MNAWTIVALVFAGTALAEVWYNFMGYWRNSRRAEEIQAKAMSHHKWLQQFHLALERDGATYEPVTRIVFHADGFAEDADAFCLAHGLEMPGDITWVRHP